MNLCSMCHENEGQLTHTFQGDYRKGADNLVLIQTYTCKECRDRVELNGLPFTLRKYHDRGSADEA